MRVLFLKNFVKNEVGTIILTNVFCNLLPKATKLYKLVWFGVMWCGVVWCVVWCGVVCCGVVWCGVV